MTDSRHAPAAAALPPPSLSTGHRDLVQRILNFCGGRRQGSPSVFLIEGKAGTGNSVVLNAAFARLQQLARLRNGQDALQGSRNRLLVNHPEMKRLPAFLRQNLSYDRGSEMACHADLSKRLTFDVWFCDPHAPWQRGSNENSNGLLRQFLPKSIGAKLASTETGSQHASAIAAGQIAADMVERIDVLIDLGLGYLQMDRGVQTLSPGEYQRLRLGSQIHSNLFGPDGLTARNSCTKRILQRGAAVQATLPDPASRQLPACCSAAAMDRVVHKSFQNYGQGENGIAKPRSLATEFRAQQRAADIDKLIPVEYG